MKVANKKNLTTYAPELLGVNYTPERAKELVRVCLEGFERQSGHVSHSYAAHLEKIDKVLGNFGVDGFCEPVDVMYSNTGDSYSMTVMYYRDRLYIGCLGDIAERYL
jgi:hypothetical protein